MLNPQELGHLTDDIEKIWQELEDELLADMAQRIVKNDYSFPTTAAWNKQKLEEIGVQYDYIVRQLSRTLKLSEKQVKHIIGKSVQAAVDTDNQVFKAALDAELLESMSDTSELLSKFIADGVKSTNGELRNFARTYAADASKAYEHAIDQAYLQVTNGFYTAQQASQTAIEQLARQGITSAITPSGRREHADVIVRRAVRTGTNQAALKAQEANFFEMGAQLVEVTAHYGARPSHAEWQGQVYEWTKSGQQKHTSYPDFVNSTGYGTGAGLGGWNCRHSFYPFFEGLSERAYEPLNAQETERVYELEQQQRYNERMIREWTRRQKTLEAGGYDASKERDKVKEWNRRNEALIKANPDVLKKNYVNEKVKLGLINGKIDLSEIKITGALDPYSKKADKHAVLYYESIRKMKSDCKKIAANTGYPIDLIKRIKYYTFIEEHELDSGKERFYPSFQMAQSWQRLIEGKNIQDHDLLLLEHEMYELTLVSLGMPQNKAHDATNVLYNYTRGCEEFYGKFKKFSQ